MSAVIALLLGTAILAGAVHDTVRLITPRRARCPSLALLRGRRAAREADERWTTGLLLRGRIGRADYQARMSRLAHGRRGPSPTRFPPPQGTHRGGGAEP
ncbi:hypothetical protein AB0I00_18915 [Streptomyces sp. NPDC050803]|uniref:hypothetical protein n=1 Tax=unclassified Streptomyces TaxID=2593676 RepID=UPI0034368EAA